MVEEAFHSDEVTVVTGGADVGAACAALPFDHLLFTGSTAVGRKIATAAASSLTPVTLELGGKSPAIIDPGADLAKAARSIVFGKAFNAGQTCVAPDYVLAPRSRFDSVVGALRVAAAEMYPEMAQTDDYSAIVSDRHFERLCALVDEAHAAGVGVMQMADAAAMSPQRKLPLTFILNPPRSLRVMQEEIFGPILPVIAYDTEQDAIAYVNAGERPLALYWFGRDRAARDRVLERTVAGGVTINGTNWHVVQENLPFGGVGASGHGVYHGVAGFETFSNMKAVFAQSRFANTAILQPPFGPRSERVLALLRRFI
jgi:coniferyl-aldehyde dehydrogenase